MRMVAWAAAALVAAGAGGMAQAVTFDRLYVFGDSLVDSGNARVLAAASGDAALALQLATLYPSGRFTNGNGRNFADYAGRALGLGDASPYVDSAFTPGPGTNFAVGGATTVFTDGETRPDLLTEIRGLPPQATQATQPNPYNYNYAAAVATGRVAPIDANSLVLLATGGNDVRGVVPSMSTSVVSEAAQAAAAGAVDLALRASIDALYAAGARNIVLVNVPDIGIIPEYAASANKAAATSLTGLVNARYATIAGDYAAQFGAAGGVFQLFDLAGLQQRITADAAAYGLDPAKVGQSCLVSGGPAAVATGCQGYAYYDTIHPTDAVHNLIGGAIVAQLTAQVPEPASWALMILGFGLAGAALRRQRPAAGLSARRA